MRSFAYKAAVSTILIMGSSWPCLGQWVVATRQGVSTVGASRGGVIVLELEGPTAAICDTNTALVLCSPNSDENRQQRLLRQRALVQQGRGLGIGQQGWGTTIGPQINQPTIGPQFNEPTIGPQFNQPTIAPQINEPTIGPQVNEPTIAPQANEPTIGQQGVIAGQPGSIPVRATLVPGQQGSGTAIGQQGSGTAIGPQTPGLAQPAGAAVQRAGVVNVRSMSAPVRAAPAVTGGRR